MAGPLIPILMAGARTRLGKKAVNKALEWYKINKKNQRIKNKQKRGEEVSGKEYTEFYKGEAKKKILRSCSEYRLAFGRLALTARRQRGNAHGWSCPQRAAKRLRKHGGSACHRRRAQSTTAVAIMRVGPARTGWPGSPRNTAALSSSRRGCACDSVSAARTATVFLVIND